MATDEEHAAWKLEARRVDSERIGEVVDRRMWRFEAELGCADHFGLSLQGAIYFVDQAIRRDVIGDDGGHVRPKGGG